MKTVDALSPLIQIITTFAALFIIFLVYALLDVDDADMINTIGFFLFQPFLASVFSAVTILICFIAGSPIRFSDKINRWWKTKPLIPIVCFVIGLLLLLISFNVNLTETKEIILNEEMVEKKVPNLATSVTGWFFVGFSLLHFYPGSLQFLIRNQK